MTAEAWLLLQACERHKITSHSDIRVFLQEQWRFPAHRRNKGRALWRIFDEWGEEANNNKDKLACSASELLSLYGLLRHFFECRVAPDARIAAELASYQCVCKLVDLILLAKRGSLSLVECGRQLRRAIAEHIQQHTRTYGLDKMRPKNHWAFDIADVLEIATWLFDCFIIERLHLRVKAVAENCKCNESYERSVLSGVVNAHARRASETTMHSTLIGKSAPFPGLANAFIADHVDMNGLRVSVGDYVFHGIDTLGQVIACCIEEGEFYVVAEALTFLARLSPSSSRWSRLTTHRMGWKACELNECLAWQCSPGSSVVVLRM